MQYKKNTKFHLLIFSFFSTLFVLSSNEVYAQVPEWSMGIEAIKGDSINVDSVSRISEVDELKKEISFTPNNLKDENGNIITASLDSLSIYAWKVDRRFGTRILANLDTTYINFGQASTINLNKLGVNSLGNIGNPIQILEFSERQENRNFPFVNPIMQWQNSPSKNLFYNTKTPYSNLYYQAGGAGDAAENRVKGMITSNFGKEVNVGFNIDYIYARGYYTGLFNKQISYDIFTSYIGERVKIQAFAGNNNSNVSLNGGVLNDKYITNPESEELARTRGNTKDIPVVFSDGIRNRIRGRNLYINGSYELGSFYKEVAETDSTTIFKKKENYIAPASVIYTLDYQDQKRMLSSPSYMTNSNRIDSVFVPNYINMDDFTGNTINGRYEGDLKDFMSYYSIKNTIGLSLNEGFKPWVKFGLILFAEANFRKYLIPDEKNTYLNHETSSNVYSIGASLYNAKSKYLHYSLNASKSINKSYLFLEGEATSFFSIADRESSLKAKFYIKNNPAEFFQNNFISRTWVFKNDFSDERRTYIGANLKFPKLSFSQTEIGVSHEALDNYIYLYDANIPEDQWTAGWSHFRRTPTQHNGIINLITFKAKQKFTIKALNLELRGIIQKSSNENVVSLPLWDFSANAYLTGIISKVLRIQVGAETRINAPYYADGFDSMFYQFYTQNKENGVKLGNFPFTNVYINMHLKKTRFFIMGYNVGQNIGNRQSFTTPHYPIDPMMFRWGLSWDFDN